MNREIHDWICTYVQDKEMDMDSGREGYVDSIYGVCLMLIGFVSFLLYLFLSHS